MATGHFIILGDRTTCGGKVLEGDERLLLHGLTRACEGDRVSCGRDGGIYQIIGGIWNITNNGRPVAGTLNSFSSCPCAAKLIPSILTAPYGEVQPYPQARKASKSHTDFTSPGTDSTQTIMPVAVIENDRAAMRDAIIRKLRSLGHQFFERSDWGALKGKKSTDDWSYTMIALHHAGRSYSCSGGAKQMLETQSDHFKSFDDISYHYGIDCQGMIYEGRDIRFKGESVRLYNTGVIGIVLLNNLSTAEEGGDIVALGRKGLEHIGVSTTNVISALQIDALLSLITALKSTFFIKYFGGHREFPNQSAAGKICPGNIAMELVKAIRIKTQLLAPPTS